MKNKPKRAKNLLCGKMLYFCSVISLLSYNAIASDSDINFATFREFLQKKIGTDIRLISQNGAWYDCHGIILAARSKYWKTLLTNSMKESNTNNIKLPYSGQTIEIILDFIYDPYKKQINITIPVTIYIELRYFADLSFNENIRIALRDVVIDFANTEEKDLEEVLSCAIMRYDYNLMTKILEVIKNEPVAPEISNYIINEISNGNSQAYLALKNISSSVLYNDLIKYDNNAILTRNL